MTDKPAVKGLKPLDPKVLEPFLKEMREKTIPGIVEAIRKRQALNEESRRWIIL